VLVLQGNAATVKVQWKISLVSYPQMISGYNTETNYYIQPIFTKIAIKMKGVQLSQCKGELREHVPPPHTPGTPDAGFSAQSHTPSRSTKCFPSKPSSHENWGEGMAGNGGEMERRERGKGSIRTGRGEQGPQGKIRKR